MTNDEKLQEKMFIYRTLESRLETLMKQRELVGNKIVEIISTIESVNEINTNDESVLFKLGAEAYAHGNIVNRNTILVDVGAGIILEKSIDEGKITLNKRKEDMENTMKGIQNNVIQISNAMSQLGPEINDLIQKSQK